MLDEVLNPHVLRGACSRDRWKSLDPWDLVEGLYSELSELALYAPVCLVEAVFQPQKSWHEVSVYATEMCGGHTPIL